MSRGALVERSVRRTTALVDLGAIERNCKLLSSVIPHGTELCAVVKADGYGHGATAVASAARRAGAGWLAVATADEAAEVRRGGDLGRLLLLGPLAGADLETAVRSGVDVVVWSQQFLDSLAAIASPASPIRVHVKYDTGMGRNGAADASQVRTLCHRVASDPRFDLVGLMTHFATADEVGDQFFHQQLTRFTTVAAQVKEQYPDVLVHGANTAATLRDPAAHLDMVRCGIGVYGLDPFHEDARARGLKPALSWHSIVTSVKTFEPGASAGYGRRWTAAARTRVAVVPVGYADGWRRGLSDNADVLIAGRRCPVVGTVSMDSMTVDLGRDLQVTPGDPVVLLGAQGRERIAAEDLAKRLGTISYEVACGVSKRVPRLYAEGRTAPSVRARRA